MRKTNMFIAAILAASALSAATPRRLPMAPPDVCTGEPCHDGYTVYPSSNWSITPFTHAGQGLSGQFPCNVCKDCTGAIAWSYSGPGTTLVTYRTELGPFYETGNSGSFPAQTECDGIPFDNTFWDSINGSFTGQLYCICVPD